MLFPPGERRFWSEADGVWIHAHCEAQPAGATTLHLFAYADTDERSMLYRYRPAAAITRNGRRYLPVGTLPC